MPIRKLVKVRPTPVAQKLERRLVKEWRTPSTAAQPVIIVDEQRGKGPLHVFVIWDEWADMDQVERSEIIMDAFEEVFGPDRSLNVTVAMGLTATEAERLGINYKP